MIHTPNPTGRPAVRPHLLAVVGLAGGLWLLVATASVLPAPPLDPSTWPGWWSASDPASAVGAVLRIVAVGLCGHLLLVTLVDLVGAILGLRMLQRLARRLAPAAWRAVVLRPVTAGALVLPGLFVPAVTAAPAMAGTTEISDPSGDAPVVLAMTWGAGDDDTPVLVAEPVAPPDADPIDAPSAPEPVEAEVAVEDVAPMAVVEATPPTVSSTALAPPADAVDTPPLQLAPPHVTVPERDETADHLDAPRPSPSPPSAGQGVHVVRPGDSFWRIAEEQVAVDLGRRPSPNEVRLYWRALIRANEDRLPVAGNPDVIFPGSELRLPDVGGAG